MIQITEVDGNTIYTELTTEAGPKEMERTYEKGVEVMETYEKVHVYEDVSLSRWELLSIHSKTSREFEYGEKLDFGQVAVVGGGFWMKLLVHIWNVPIWPLVPDEVRHFSAAESAEAREWIQTGGKSESPPRSQD